MLFVLSWYFSAGWWWDPHHWSTCRCLSVTAPVSTLSLTSCRIYSPPTPSTRSSGCSTAASPAARRPMTPRSTGRPSCGSPWMASLSRSSSGKTVPLCSATTVISSSSAMISCACTSSRSRLAPSGISVHPASMATMSFARKRCRTPRSFRCLSRRRSCGALVARRTPLLSAAAVDPHTAWWSCAPTVDQVSAVASCAISWISWAPFSCCELARLRCSTSTWRVPTRRRRSSLSIVAMTRLLRLQFMSLVMRYC